MATTPSSASGASSPSSSGGAANLLAAMAATSATSSSSDLGSKYQKLAGEYSKLRSQFGVVKKAVLEEQARSAELSDRLRDRELDERKREAEMESIKFRNQQLTKRIQVSGGEKGRDYRNKVALFCFYCRNQVLQEEMELQEQRIKQGKKGAKGGSSSLASAEVIQSSESLNSVIGRELQSKIDENASLHAKLSDVDRRYEDLVASLQDRIKELEGEAKARAQAERAEDTRHRDLAAGLRADKEELSRQVRQLERELVDHQDRITVLTVQLESATPSGGMAVSPVKQAPSANFPLTAVDARVQSVELLSQFGDCVTSLVAGLSDFHTYWEHRLKDVSADGPLWDDADRLSKLLMQNVKHLKPVEEAYQDVLSRVLSRKEGDRSPVLAYFSRFSQSFIDYVSFACEAETLTVSCLQYESHRYSCPPSQQAFNSQLQSSLRSFHRVLSRAGDYLKEATSAAEKDGGDLENLSVCLSQLSAQAGELARTYANKAADESALPTVTERLRDTNQCIVAALTSVNQAVADLSRLLADNLGRVSVLLQSGEGFHTSVDSDGNEQGSGEVIDTTRDGTTNGEERTNEELDNLREKKEHLEEVVASMSEKVKELEQKREHWKLEFQLLQMKYEKLKGGDEESSDAKEDPLRLRLSELLGERLEADSKAVSLLLEYRSQRRRLRAAVRRWHRAEERLGESERANKEAKEEAGTAAANYEGQLGLMAEHVANMNDKLASQSDEIEGLKYELANKGNKKGSKAKGK